MAVSKFEFQDRLDKYGWGFFRLCSLLLLFIFIDRGSGNAIGSTSRWLTYLWIGSMGAGFNVEAFGSSVPVKIAFVCVGVCVVIHDLSIDPVIILYASKTLIPDFLAGKIDTSFFRFILGLLLCFLAVVLASSVFSLIVFDFQSWASSLLLVWAIHAFGQLVCELGDNHLESITFFRHRFSYELTCVLIWMFMPLTQASDPTTLKFARTLEKELLYFDMTACVAYRLSNWCLKKFDLDRRSAITK